MVFLHLLLPIMISRAMHNCGSFFSHRELAELDVPWNWLLLVCWMRTSQYPSERLPYQLCWDRPHFQLTIFKRSCVVWVVFGEEILPCDQIQLKEQDQHLSCISGNIFFWWATVFNWEWFNSSIESPKQHICVHWIDQRMDMSCTAVWQQCMCLVKKSSEQMGTNHFLMAPWVAILTSFPVNRVKLNNFGHGENQEWALALEILILCPFLGCSHYLLCWCGGWWNPSCAYF